MSFAQKNRVRPGLENLEQRDMLSVSSVALAGDVLVIKSDSAGSNVSVAQVGTTIRVTEGTRSWDNPAVKVRSIDFQGGGGADRFVNRALQLPAKAAGGAGADYLEGGDAADYFLGGDGDDTLVGNGHNDVLNGGAGKDTLRGNAGDDVFIAIDNGLGDTLTGGAGKDTFWIDYTEVWGFNARYTDDITDKNATDDLVQSVEKFANGADRTLNGDRIADPNATVEFTREDGTKYSSTYKYQTFAGNPLFPTAGPTANDIEQGGIGDCWLMAGLGSVAQNAPLRLRQYVVDFGDGTYGVRLKDSLYRVDNDLPVNSSGSPAFAGLGAQNSMWAAVVEKAFAHYRTGANSYQSLNGGMSSEVATALGSKDALALRFTSAFSMAQSISNSFVNKEMVAVGINWFNGTDSSSRHALAVVGVNWDARGNVTSITLRNPWGYDGGGINIDGKLVTDFNTSDGLIKLTPDQLFKLSPRVYRGEMQ